MTTPPHQLPQQTIERIKTITLVIFDVDGVLTDGRITYSDDGSETKSFNVQDGYAIKLLQENQIAVGIITGRRSSIVQRRADELGINHLYQGVANKEKAFAKLLSALKLDPLQVAHVGDDLPDLTLFEQVGLAISVPNGHPVCQQRADLVTTARGGEGVAREVCELMLRVQGKWSFE